MDFDKKEAEIIVEALILRAEQLAEEERIYRAVFMLDSERADEARDMHDEVCMMIVKFKYYIKARSGELSAPNEIGQMNQTSYGGSV